MESKWAEAVAALIVMLVNPVGSAVPPSVVGVVILVPVVLMVDLVAVVTVVTVVGLNFLVSC